MLFLSLLPFEPLCHLGQEPFGAQIQPVAVMRLSLVALGFFRRGGGGDGRRIRAALHTKLTEGRRPRRGSRQRRPSAKPLGNTRRILLLHLRLVGR
jgi:hypothetical protein